MSSKKEDKKKFYDRRSFYSNAEAMKDLLEMRDGADERTRTFIKLLVNTNYGVKGHEVSKS